MKKAAFSNVIYKSKLKCIRLASFYNVYYHMNMVMVNFKRAFEIEFMCFHL